MVVISATFLFFYLKISIFVVYFIYFIIDMLNTFIESVDKFNIVWYIKYNI